MSPGGLVPDFGPLNGIRVLDTGRVVAGPWAATILGDFGAEIIHIEGPPFVPPYADPTRGIPPLLPEGELPENSVSESWIQYSRNKLSLGLDVTKKDGASVFLELVKRSDIWIDASRPGTFDKFGLDDRAVLAANPRMVIVHVSGFGQTGRPEYVSRASFSIVAEAFSGYLASQGEPPPQPPTQSATAINDLVTGLGAALGAMMAYVNAGKTGKGQVVDVAQYELFFLMMENMTVDFFMRGVTRARYGNAHPRLQPYEIYRAKDGWIVLAAPTPRSWERLRDWAKLPNDANWNSMGWRVKNRDEVNARITEVTVKHSIEELEAIGVEQDIAFAPILTMKDIAGNKHYKERQMLLEWEDPAAGKVTGAGIAPKFSDTPGRVWRGAPWLGQDNELVLKGILDYDDEEIAALRSSGILGERKRVALR